MFFQAIAKNERYVDFPLTANYFHFGNNCSGTTLRDGWSAEVSDFSFGERSACVHFEYGTPVQGDGHPSFLSFRLPSAKLG